VDDLGGLLEMVHPGGRLMCGTEELPVPLTVGELVEADEVLV